MTFNLFKISKLLYTRIERNVISKKKLEQLCICIKNQNSQILFAIFFFSIPIISQSSLLSKILPFQIACNK